MNCTSKLEFILLLVPPPDHLISHRGCMCTCVHVAYMYTDRFGGRSWAGGTIYIYMLPYIYIYIHMHQSLSIYLSI